MILKSFWLHFRCFWVGVSIFSNMWICWFLIPLPCNLCGFRGSEASQINQTSFKKHDRAPISILSWLLVDLWSFWHPCWLPKSIQTPCSNLIDFWKQFGIVFVCFWIRRPPTASAEVTGFGGPGPLPQQTTRHGPPPHKIIKFHRLDVVFTDTYHLKHIRYNQSCFITQPSINSYRNWDILNPRGFDAADANPPKIIPNPGGLSGWV